STAGRWPAPRSTSWPTSRRRPTTGCSTTLACWSRRTPRGTPTPQPSSFAPAGSAPWSTYWRGGDRPIWSPSWRGSGLRGWAGRRLQRREADHRRTRGGELDRVLATCRLQMLVLEFAGQRPGGGLVAEALAGQRDSARRAGAAGRVQSLDDRGLPGAGG